MHPCFFIFEEFHSKTGLIHKHMEHLGGFWSRGKIKDRFDIIMDSNNQKFFDFYFDAAFQTILLLFF